jgi:hypothetical protein
VFRFTRGRSLVRSQVRPLDFLQNHAGLHREEESADHLMTTGRAFGFAVLGRFGDHAVKHRDGLADLAGEEVAVSVCDATVLDAHEAATPGGAVAV